MAGFSIVGLSCNTTTSPPATDLPTRFFYVNNIQLQSSFTRLLPAGIDVYVVLLDQFGDPIKALGQFQCELFPYKPAASDPRGKRFNQLGLQTIDLNDPQTSQKHWDPITQGYYLRLKIPPDAASTQHLVLQITFFAQPDQRLQDTLVLPRAK